MSRPADKNGHSEQEQLPLDAAIGDEPVDVVDSADSSTEAAQETGMANLTDVSQSGSPSHAAESSEMAPPDPDLERQAADQSTNSEPRPDHPTNDSANSAAPEVGADKTVEDELLVSSGGESLPVDPAADDTPDPQLAANTSASAAAPPIAADLSPPDPLSKVTDKRLPAADGKGLDRKVGDRRLETGPEAQAETTADEVGDTAGTSLSHPRPEASGHPSKESGPAEAVDGGEPSAAAAQTGVVDENAEAKDDELVELDGRIFYLTNRFNYLDNLSSRLVRPDRAMQKYYQDLLSIRDGVVPLVNTGVSRGLIEYVEADSPQAFPILLELDAERLEDTALPALSTEDEAVSGSFAGGFAAYAPDGVVPMSIVRAAIFRSEDEKIDFLSRRVQYKNLDVDSIDLRVEAGLFEKTSLSVSTVGPWLDGLDIQSGIAVAEIRTADRVAGGICLCAAAIPAELGYVELIANLITGVKPSKAKLKGLPHWIVGGRLQTLKPEARRKMDLEEMVFDAVGRVILDTDPGERWRPREVLDRIVAVVESRPLSDEDRVKFTSTADYIRRVLTNETDLEPFTPGKGISSAKALLIFLQRPEPQRLLQARRSYPGVTDGEMVTAAAYSGLLLGLAQIPAEFRMDGIDDVLGNMEAWFLNQKASSPLVAGDRRTEKPTVETRVEVDGRFVAGVDLGGLGDFEIRRRLSLLEILRRVAPTSPAMGVVVDLVEALAAHFQDPGWIEECLWSYIEGESTKVPERLNLPAGTTAYRGSRKSRIVPDRDLVLQRIDQAGLPDEIDERFRGPFLKAQFPAMRRDRSDPGAGRLGESPAARRS